MAAASAVALPPLDNVLSGLERFRSLTGHLRGECRLTYSSRVGEILELDRPWNEPPRLTSSTESLVLDWADGGLDMPLRLVGATLGAEDLSEALRAMGRWLEPDLQTLAFIGDDVVFVVGGPLSAATPHVFIERETYRLRAVDLPMPEGNYRVELNHYSLADGWFPGEIVVMLQGEVVLQLTVSSIESS